MSIGNSGRIVLEIDPVLKKELYQAVIGDDLNLKQWFLMQVDDYLKNRHQTAFDFSPRTGILENEKS